MKSSPVLYFWKQSLLEYYSSKDISRLLGSTDVTADRVKQSSHASLNSPAVGAVEHEENCSQYIDTALDKDSVKNWCIK